MPGLSHRCSVCLVPKLGFYPVGSEGDLDSFTQNNERVIVMRLKKCSGTCAKDGLEGGRKLTRGLLQSPESNDNELKVVTGREEKTG